MPQSVEVLGTDKRDDREYARVNFLGDPVLLRLAEGVIHSFDPDQAEEKVWLDLSAADGESRPASIDRCTRSAHIETRSASVETAAGKWDNALQLIFEGTCADAGMTTMYFVPGVGPVVYEQSSIAGPVRYELWHSSSATEAPQVGFTAALDAPTYKAGNNVEIVVRLTLRNSHSQPVTLTFPSGQRYDLRIVNDRGESVYVWSADKLFIQAIGTELVGPGERTFAFTATVPALEAGRYVAEAWLATISREYEGRVGFEVTAQ